MVKKRIYLCIAVMRCTHCKFCATKTHKYIFLTYRHRDIHKTNKNISLLLFLIFRSIICVCVIRYVWIGICVNVCVRIVKLLVKRLSYITRCTFDAYAQSSQHSMSLTYDRDYLVKSPFQSNRDKEFWYFVQSSFYRNLCKFCVVFPLIHGNRTYLVR